MNLFAILMAALFGLIPAFDCVAELADLESWCYDISTELENESDESEKDSEIDEELFVDGHLAISAFDLDFKKEPKPNENLLKTDLEVPSPPPDVA